MSSPRPKAVAPTRKDPRPTNLGGLMVRDQTGLRNADPAFKYKLVHPHDGEVQIHQEQGWSVVMRRKDGPSLASGATSKEGEPVEWKGHVLMQMPVDVWERNERDGHLGNGLGQDYFDIVEQMIADPTQGLDGIARQGGQYAKIVNETKPNRAITADL